MVRSLPVGLGLALLLAVARPGVAAGPRLDRGRRAAAWTPANADSVAPRARHGEGRHWLRFDLPFTRLKGWRFRWDRAGAWNLGHCRRLLVRARVGNDSAPGPVVVTLTSGPGRYRLPGFSLTRRWRSVALDLRQAAVEGRPSGWDHITGLRLSVLPGGGDTWLDVAGIQGQRRAPDDWVWRVGGARSKRRFFAAVMEQVRGRAFVDARVRLSEADSLLNKARRLGGRARRRELRQARAQAAQAWALAQRPLPPQAIRGVWIRHGAGPSARWKASLPALAAQGINWVLFSPSGLGGAVSPTAAGGPGPADGGGDLGGILDAAHPVGMQVMVAQVLGRVPAGAIEARGRQGRLQLDDHGTELPWLCPCDERNRRLELAALVALATRYPIDGVQLEGLRFDGPDAGFGPSCEARFEATTGKVVAHWPADCAPGGPLAADYAAFKREVISSFVRDVSVALRAVRPGIRISAAVLPYPAMARERMSQDWPAWIKAGWVDFVCPLDDSADPDALGAVTRAQAALVGGGRLLVCIPTSLAGGRTAPLDEVARDLQAASALGTRGTFFYGWHGRAREALLPYLNNGVWRRGPYDLKLGGLTPKRGKGPSSSRKNPAD